jgi:hypothetical protein
LPHRQPGNTSSSVTVQAPDPRQEAFLNVRPSNVTGSGVASFHVEPVSRASARPAGGAGVPPGP